MTVENEPKMKIQELRIITEMPQLTGPTEFGLSNTAVNKKSAVELLKKKTETIEDTADYELFMTGDGRNGYIVLYDKGSQLVGYLIKYKEMTKSLTGKTITQVMLWRMVGNSNVIGKTREIFFGLLLQRWPSIMSDSIQTERGMEFWKDRCAEAYSKGYKVGLVDYNENRIDWYDESASFIEWFNDLDAWGPEEKYQAVRFIISN